MRLKNGLANKYRQQLYFPQDIARKDSKEDAKVNLGKQLCPLANLAALRETQTLRETATL
jgi:hypothetical protein